MRICFDLVAVVAVMMVVEGMVFRSRAERGLICAEYLSSDVVQDCPKDWLILTSWTLWINVVTNQNLPNQN